MARIARSLHPVAWWGWAVGLAAAASLTTNPLLLALITAVVVTVVLARRDDSPWAQAFRLYLYLALAVIALRVAFQLLVGVNYGERLLLNLPSIGLPSWAAGINLLGPIYLEALLGALLIGARLGVLIMAIGAANALANPRRLLRAVPNALHEVGTAVVVGVSVAPQLAASVQRVWRARQLRGDTARGLAVVRRVAVPVLQDTLDRSLMLAAAMESRGYGHRSKATSRMRALTAAASLGGLLCVSFGIYSTLDPTIGAGWGGLPALAIGVGLITVGLIAGGKVVQVSVYRPDRWGLAEVAVLISGLAALVGVLITDQQTPGLLHQSLQPLTAPSLPGWATAGVLAALAPLVLAPPPPAGRTGAYD